MRFELRILLINFWRVIDSKGGTEKVLIDMANEFNRRGYEVTIICCENKEGKPFFPLDSKINFINIYNAIGRKGISFKIKREMLRIISKENCNELSEVEEEKCIQKPIQEVISRMKPDIIVAFQPTVTSILKNTMSLSIPVITMFHVFPKELFDNMSERVRQSLLKTDCIQVLLPSYIDVIKKMYSNSLSSKKIVCIPNSAPQFSKEVSLLKDKSVYKLITVGRINKEEKQTHLLIELLNELKNKFIKWELEVWGEIIDKDYYAYINQLVHKYDLKGKVHFKGTSDNIIEILKQADIFILSSAYEGFSLALAEAMSVGLPVIGFNYCTGLNEIVKNGYSGFLCDDLEDMVNKSALLMEDYELRVKMGKNAHVAMKNYQPSRIWDQWNELFMNLTKNSY